MQTSVIPVDLESGDGKKWLESVHKALRGKSYESLRSKTLDDCVLEPLYSSAQSVVAVSGRPAGLPWQIVHRLNSQNLPDANSEVKSAIANGSDCIDLEIATAFTADKSALEIRTIDDIAKLFDGIDLTATALRITGGLDSVSVFAAVMEHAKKAGINFSKMNITHAFDLTLSSFGTATMEQARYRAKCLADQLQVLGADAIDSRIFAVDSRLWHNAGANNFQELALCMAQMVESIRTLEETGITPQQFSQKFSVILSADSDQFANIAKFRAVRILLHKVLQHCNAEVGHFPVHAESSWRMMTVLDPWVNLLRTTLACFSAGIGGADSITILPHTFATGEVDELSLRLARNTQSILQEESYLTKVADPAAGSGIVEDLTDKLCASAWQTFQEIERQGGLIAATASGYVKSLVNSTGESRRKNVSVGESPITGVSTFPNIEDKAVKPVQDSKNAQSDKDYTASLPQPANGEWFKAIRQIISVEGRIPTTLDKFANQSNTGQVVCSRLSEPFEELREIADNLAKHGSPPTIFLAGLGPLANFLPVANFAKNFFESAGIRTTQNMAQQSAEELIASYADSKSQIVCLCANQSGFAEFGKDMMDLLKEAGAKKIYVAGKPDNNESIFADSDIEDWVYNGCDMLGVLNKALESYS